MLVVGVNSGKMMEEDEDGEKLKVLQGTPMMFPVRRYLPLPIRKNLVYTSLVANHFQHTMNPKISPVNWLRLHKDIGPELLWSFMFTK